MPRIKRLRNSIQLYGWKSCRCINQSLTKWAPSRCSQTRSIESSPSPPSLSLLSRARPFNNPGRGNGKSRRKEKLRSRVPAAVQNLITISKEAAISRNSRNYLDSTFESSFDRCHFQPSFQS